MAAKTEQSNHEVREAIRELMDRWNQMMRVARAVGLTEDAAEEVVGRCLLVLYGLKLVQVEGGRPRIVSSSA